MTQGNLIFLKFADVKVPLFKENRAGEYVRCGENNLYPNELLEKFNKSSKQNAIVLGKVNYIMGNGFQYKDGSTTPFLTNPNPVESLDEIGKKAVIDLEVFEGFALEVHWNLAGNIAAIYHLPFHKVRVNKDLTQFYIKDWTSLKTTDKPEILPAFNPNVRQGKQVLYFKTYRPAQEIYPLPSYIGALNAIQTDIEISKYHLSTISNGMFSSKMISFFQGEPTEEEKSKIEKNFKGKFTGSENAGNIVLGFYDDPAKAPTVQDLSATELDKHFDVLQKTVTQEIFTGHQVTSPMLFGIKTEGQLGGRNEIREAYEIFKNTYINDKQKAVEGVFTMLSGYAGYSGELMLIPVEPIGVEFSEQTLLQIAPKSWLLEKVGIDPTKYPETQAATGGNVNENLKNLTGRQWQSLNRIIRNFANGKISAEQAKMLLQSSLGLTDEQCAMMLSIDDAMEFSAQEKDELLLAEFAKVGEKKSDYVILKSRKVMTFADEMVTELQAEVLDLIKKDKRITAEVIAEVLNMEVANVNRVLKQLETDGRLTTKTVKRGQDTIVERSLTEPLSKITEEKPKTTSFKILYSYEGPQDSRNRTFCARLLEMDKLYSRAEIETMSKRLGYSVWDRRGGWWTMPDGTHSKSCRHNWQANLTVKRDS